MPVNTPRDAYKEYVEQWCRARDCYSGSDAVKERGAKYLPPLDSHVEKPEKFLEYKKRALFYNATGRTVDGLAGAIFQRAPIFKLPTLIQDHVEDITLTNVPAELFAQQATRELLITGRYGILVDMTTVAAVDQRPYWIGYRAEDIISWWVETRGGDQVLVRVVLREFVEQLSAEDSFVVEVIEQYRVLALDTEGYFQTIWRKQEDTTAEKWVMVQGPQFPERRGARFSFIPFIFLGPRTITPAIEKPPLIDLVDVNLSHYRTMADLEHGRHFTALPTPWIAGAREEDSKKPLSIGSGTAWILEKDGKAGMLEFTGQGLGALEKADEQKRKMMATLGARLLEDQPESSETATGILTRHVGEHATLRTIAQSVEQGITQVFRWHDWWVGTGEADPRDSKALMELNKDFFSSRITPQELQGLVEALQTESISFQTFYSALVRGELARPGISAEEEQKLIEKEAKEREKNRPKPTPGVTDSNNPGVVPSKNQQPPGKNR